LIRPCVLPLAPIKLGRGGVLERSSVDGRPAVVSGLGYDSAKAFHHCRGGTCWQASASRRAEADGKAAAEVSLQGGTSWWPWAWYSRAWIRHSSLSASLASRASRL